MNQCVNACRKWIAFPVGLSLATLLLISPAFCAAAQILVGFEYGQKYNSDLTVALGTPNTVFVGEYIQLNVRMQLSGAVAGEDFSSVGFNVLHDAGLVPLVLAGSSPWMSPGTAANNLGSIGGPYASFPQPSPAVQSYLNYDNNGASPGGITQHFSQNVDGGTAGDSPAILIAAGNLEANNRQYGEASRPGAGYADQLGAPTLLGTLILCGLAAVIFVVRTRVVRKPASA